MGNIKKSVKNVYASRRRSQRRIYRNRHNALNNVLNQQVQQLPNIPSNTEVNSGNI